MNKEDDNPHCKCENSDNWESLDLDWFGKMVRCTKCKSQFFVRYA